MARKTLTQLVGTVAMVAALSLPAYAQEGLNGEEDESWLDTGVVWAPKIVPSVGCNPWETVVANGGYFLPGAAAARSEVGTDNADFIQGGDGDDFLSTGGGNDTVMGGDGGDLVISETGDDLLFGGNGKDALFAAEGDDTLVAGAGDDELSAGIGADLFVVGEGVDTILDFDSFEGQKIALPASAVVGFECAADFIAARMTVEERGIRVDLGNGNAVVLMEPPLFQDSVFVLIAE